MSKSSKVILLSPEHLATLKEKDEFKSEGLFQGLTPTETLWKVVSAKPEANEWILCATYFNIKLAEVVVTVIDGKLKMEVL